MSNVAPADPIAICRVGSCTLTGLAIGVLPQLWRDRTTSTVLVHFFVLQLVNLLHLTFQVFLRGGPLQPFFHWPRFICCEGYRPFWNTALFSLQPRANPIAFCRVGSCSLTGLAIVALLRVWTVLTPLLQLDPLIELRGGLPVHSIFHWPHYICSDAYRSSRDSTLFYILITPILLFLHTGTYFTAALLLANLALKWQRVINNLQLHFCARSWNSDVAIDSWSAPSGRQSRRSGPKSRHCPARLNTWIFFLVFYIRLTLTLDIRGEGCDLTMQVTEVPGKNFFALHSGTKQHGRQPPMCPGTQVRPEPSRIQDKVEKRRLKRAYKRAIAQGFAWYRGKCYSRAALEQMGC